MRRTSSTTPWLCAALLGAVPIEGFAQAEAAAPASAGSDTAAATPAESVDPAKLAHFEEQALRLVVAGPLETGSGRAEYDVVRGETPLEPAEAARMGIPMGDPFVDRSAPAPINALLRLATIPLLLGCAWLGSGGAVALGFLLCTSLYISDTGLVTALWGAFVWAVVIGGGPLAIAGALAGLGAVSPLAVGLAMYAGARTAPEDPRSHPLAFSVERHNLALAASMGLDPASLPPEYFPAQGQRPASRNAANLLVRNSLPLAIGLLVSAGIFVLSGVTAGLVLAVILVPLGGWWLTSAGLGP